MTGSDMCNFDPDFEALLGHPPFPWQRRLHERMVVGNPPDAVDVPTGLGKTAAVACWLLALAAEPTKVPRRLIYVVNRRTIVDQVTTLVEAWVGTQGKPGRLALPELASVRQGLTTISRRGGNAVEDALVVSTLRGELADNGLWRLDAARPAIIVGTPDLIGSGLLFSAYRESWKLRAFHAGLFGHDCLIVHDEAHLTWPFQALLEAVRDYQRCTSCGRPLPDGDRNVSRVLALSATAAVGGKNVMRFGEPEDVADDQEVALARYDAAKRLHLTKNPANVIETIRDLALKHQGRRRRVIVYVRSPEDAGRIAAELADGFGPKTKRTAGVGQDRVALLTGQIRGRERDALVESPVLRALRGLLADGSDRPKGSLYGAEDGEATVYLVSTSAGEVGADFDADDLVCDLTTADAMIQRLGRVNRRGDRKGGDASSVDVVAAKPERKIDKKTGEDKTPPLDRALANTFDLLSALPVPDDAKDASPRATREDEAWQQARKDDHIAPSPGILRLTTMMVDALSLTSVDRRDWPLVPDVAALIHGLEDDRPETTVLWRAEVNLLAEHGAAEADLLRVFRRYPPRAAERLRVPTSRLVAPVKADKKGRPTSGDNPSSLRQRVAELANRNPDGPEHRAVLIGDDGAAWLPLTEKALASADLRHKTLLLPVAFGGLGEGGMLDATADADPTRLDVADAAGVERRRVLLRRVGEDGEGEWRAEVMGHWCAARLFADAEEATDGAIDLLDEAGVRLAVRERVALAADADAEPTRVLLLLGPVAEAKGGWQPTLVEHTKDVCEAAERGAGKLALPEGVTPELFRLAGEWHDKGKERKLWQDWIYNDGGVTLAKPGRRGTRPPSYLRGYRHEFGSLRDLVQSPKFKALGEDDRDVVLHLIASHHGFGRPHFKERATVDPSTPASPVPSELSAGEVARRFDRLQRRFGVWGLAWLESILRCADAAVGGDIDAPSVGDDPGENQEEGRP